MQVGEEHAMGHDSGVEVSVVVYSFCFELRLNKCVKMTLTT